MAQNTVNSAVPQTIRSDDNESKRAIHATDMVTAAEFTSTFSHYVMSLGKSKCNGIFIKYSCRGTCVILVYSDAMVQE